jgi:hypothetical protein
MTPDGRNRFTDIGERLTAALKADPDYRPGDRMIVMMHDLAIGGTTLEGYAADYEAVEDLYNELNRIAAHNGARLVIVESGSN